jgi:hypothetical protein
MFECFTDSATSTEDAGVVQASLDQNSASISQQLDDQLFSIELWHLAASLVARAHRSLPLHIVRDSTIRTD